MAAATSQGP